MRSFRKLAFAVASALWIGATPAGAVVMLATYTGTVARGTDATDFFGLGGDLAGADFTAVFKYDTDLGVPTTTPISDTRSGGPGWSPGSVSPILSASLTLNDGVGAGVTDYFDVSEDGTGNVFNNGLGWEQTFFQSGYDFFDATTLSRNFLQLYVLSAPSPILLTTPFTGGNIGVVEPPLTDPEFGKFLQVGGVVETDYSGLFLPVSVTLSAYVPEPETWALLIGGFAAVGAALRRRRAAAALA